jgi:spore germination protein GerM
MRTAGIIIMVFAIAALSFAIYSRNNPFVSLNLNPNSTSTAAQAGTKVVELYFPNKRLDAPSICPGIFPVERTVLDAPTVMRDALALLLSGPSKEETEKGYTTEIKGGAAIQSLKLEDGLVSVDLTQPILEESATACAEKTAIAQIEATLKSFPNVNTVMVAANGQAQP